MGEKRRNIGNIIRAIVKVVNFKDKLKNVSSFFQNFSSYTGIFENLSKTEEFLVLIYQA